MVGARVPRVVRSALSAWRGAVIFLAGWPTSNYPALLRHPGLSGIAPESVNPVKSMANGTDGGARRRSTARGGHGNVTAARDCRALARDR